MEVLNGTPWFYIALLRVQIQVSIGSLWFHNFDIIYKKQVPNEILGSMQNCGNLTYIGFFKNL